MDKKSKVLRNKKVGVRFDKRRVLKDTVYHRPDVQNDLTKRYIHVPDSFYKVLDSEEDLDFEESLIEENL